MDALTWLADHPARGDGAVRPQPIPRTHAPERVAVFAAYRDAAYRQAIFWRFWGMEWLCVEWMLRGDRAQARLEQGRGE